MLNLAEAALKVKVKLDAIRYLVSELARLHNDHSHIDDMTQYFILLNHFGQKRMKKIFAIQMRMRCLTNMMTDKRMHGWTMMGKELDCTLTHEAVFYATAITELKLLDGNFFFDPEEFFNTVLLSARSKGSA